MVLLLPLPGGDAHRVSLPLPRWSVSLSRGAHGGGDPCRGAVVQGRWRAPPPGSGGAVSAGLATPMSHARATAT
jgi:hypothetical protein